MSYSPEYQELLEKYIRQELTEEERTEVEELLLLNEEARNELKRLENIFALGQQADLTQTSKSDKQQEFSSESNTKFLNSAFYRAAAIIILLLATAVALIFVSTGDEPATVEEADREWRQEFAEAYDPNPYLEDIIGDVLRGDRPQISLSTPPTDYRINAIGEEGEYQLHFEGEASGIDPDHVEIRLYSNETEDYIEEKPIYNESLQLDDATFRTQLSVTLSPGLYYYTVENIESADILLAGRVIIE